MNLKPHFFGRSGDIIRASLNDVWRNVLFVNNECDSKRKLIFDSFIFSISVVICNLGVRRPVRGYKLGNAQIRQMIIGWFVPSQFRG